MLMIICYIALLLMEITVKKTALQMLVILCSSSKKHLAADTRQIRLVALILELMREWIPRRIL